MMLLPLEENESSDTEFEMDLVSMDEPLIQKPPNTTVSTCWKRTKTLCLLCAWISMGSFMEIAGPTLKDLVYRIDTDYEAVSGAVSGRSIGKFVGSLLGGFLMDKFGRLKDLFVAVPVSLSAVTVALVPWTYSTDLLWFMYFILGVLLGTINIAGQRILLMLWKEKAASPLHILHLGYGIGGFIAPLIANPFLADVKEIISNDTSSNTSYYTTHVMTHVTTSLNSNATHVTQANINISNNVLPTVVTEELSNSRIEYAYGIVAIITMVVSFVFYIYQFQSCMSPEKYNDSKVSGDSKKDPTKSLMRQLKDMINPATCAGGNFCYGSVILVLLFLRYFFYTGGDRVIGTFIRSYAVDQLNFSKDDGSYINTVYWISYAAGRFICFLLTRWVSVKIVLVGESVINVGVCVCLVIFARDNSLSLWVLTALLGCVIGPMFPTGIAWGDLHIEMTGLAITWVMFGSATGGLTFLRVSGFAYDHYGPTSFVYLLLVLSVVIITFDLLLTCASVIQKRKSRKIDTNEEESESS